MTLSLNMSADVIRELAEANDVCVRPVVHEVTDTETGLVQLVPTRCGSTLASKCRPCAQRNRILRMQQCREGWHLEVEPATESHQPELDDINGGGSEEADEPTRRVRSTRRRLWIPERASRLVNVF